MSEKELLFEYRNGAYTESVSKETQKSNSFSLILAQWSTHPKLLGLTYQLFKYTHSDWIFGKCRKEDCEISGNIDKKFQCEEYIHFISELTCNLLNGNFSFVD